MENQNLTPFEIGDVVKLKSGSPKMTVKEVDFNNVYCVYFNEVTHNPATFDADMDLLEKVQ